MIGVICETTEEIQSLQDDMGDPHIRECAGMTFVTGTVCEKPVTAVCTNSGKVNNAVCAQILLGEMGADMIIGFGTARGLSEGLTLGDVILVRKSNYFDVDASALGYQPGEVIGLGETEFDADEDLLAAGLEACRKVLAEDAFRVGTAITGDKIVTESQEQEQLHILWEADCADMEGAAIAQVAYLHQKPWLLFRAVSELPEWVPDESEDALEVLDSWKNEDELELPDQEEEDFLYFRETTIENFTRILRELLKQL